MKKRIKARVRQTKRVSDDFAIEVYRRGRKLAQFSYFWNGKLVDIMNIRYKGKDYFVVRVENTFEWENGKIDCIEL